MYENCLYFVKQHNEWCYHMNYMKDKKTDGVLCNKVRKRKYCPWHPTNREKGYVYSGKKAT